MGLIVGNWETVRIAWAIRSITCEQCGKSYAYEVARSARGSSTSTLWLDNAAARERAAVAAKAAAEKSLQSAYDPVACPFCAHISEAAFQDITRRRLEIPSMILVIFILLLILIPIIDSVIRSKLHPAPTPVRGGWLMLIAALVVSIVMFCVSCRLLRVSRSKFDLLAPNHKWRLAPPALIEIQDASGTYFAPAMPIQLIRSTRGLIVQVHRIGLPANCVGCGVKTDRNFLPPVAMNHETETYKCCENCQEPDARRWRAVSLLTIIILLAVAALIAITKWMKPEFVNYLVAAVTALVVTPIAAIVIPNITGQPLRRRNIDSSRGWVCISARSVAYQRLVEVRYQSSENYRFDMQREALATEPYPDLRG